jgi:hypothetical protein
MFGSLLLSELYLCLAPFSEVYSCLGLFFFSEV